MLNPALPRIALAYLPYKRKTEQTPVCIGVERGHLRKGEVRGRGQKNSKKGAHVAASQ